MYLEHFGLRETPFGLTPDISFFFACSSYQEVLHALLVVARSGEGFIRIVGEAGIGKTLLCRKFLAMLNQGDCVTATAIGTQDKNIAERTDAKFVTAYLPNSCLEPRSLLLALAGELRIGMDKNADQQQLLQALTGMLLNYAREGKRVLVCLDEAQAMPMESLEVLRLLTDLETGKCRLMQVVLFGRTELEERLNQNPVFQHISFKYELKALRSDELNRYLRHRLGVAGFSGAPIFTKGAVGILQRVSGGMPRLVNIIANKALLLAFGEGRHQVLPRHVRGAAEDTPEARRDWLVRLGGVAALMLSLLVTSWGLMR